tara:strand:+ start:9436 stop:9792 length:357 start_codon:yes stop_codon:yes gene_type:complete
MRIGGKIQIKVDGQQYRAKGSFTYNLGKDKKEAVVGSDGVHGFKVTPQVAFIEGTITDSSNISLEKLLELEDVTVILELANGKIISLSGASFTSEGNVTTEEGEIDARFEGDQAEEIR